MNFDKKHTAEIARVGGRYAVEGHSRSLMLVPIEARICDFLSVNNTNLHPISHRFPVIVQYWSNHRLCEYLHKSLLKTRFFALHFLFQTV